MTTPLVYDTGTDASRLRALLEMEHGRPIHLTTAIFPLPEELAHLPNLTYLRISPMSRTSNAEWGFTNELADLSRLADLDTLILEANIFRREIPDSFYNLKNLKHLTIKKHWFTQPLSDKIANFTELETLEIRGYFTGKIPDTIGQLTQLQRLIVRDTNSYLEGSSDIEVPETVWDLTNLREIRIGPGYTAEPLDTSRIVNLRELEILELVIPIKNIPDEFWQLPNLREVHIHAAEQTVVPSLFDTQIKSLGLHIPKLSAVPTLPPDLEKFDLRTNSSIELPSLKNTVIRDLSLSGKFINTVPDLPDTLEILSLYDLSITSLPTLPSLKSFRISSLYQLEELPILPDTLVSLRIGYCTKLRYLPDSLKLDFLWLVSCPTLSQLPSGLVVDTLVIDFCKNILELPDDLVVHSRISMTGMNIEQMPEFPEHVQVHIYEDY